MSPKPGACPASVPVSSKVLIVVSALVFCLVSSAWSDNSGFDLAVGIGGLSIDVANDVATDGSGNVYVTGSFGSTVDFDPGVDEESITAVGNTDVYVCKFDVSGNLIWAKSFGGSGLMSGLSIAVDGLGNVYTTGSFRDTGDFNPGAAESNLTSAGETDIFICKLNPSGNFFWAVAIGGTDRDVGYGIDVDATGNVYVTGYFNGTVDFDPGAGTSNLTSAGQTDSFVLKLDTSGMFQWAGDMGGGGYDYGRGIAVLGTGVYTTGDFWHSASFTSGTGDIFVTGAGSRDAFVQKLDTSGNVLWAKGLGGEGNDTGFGIAVDSSGSAYTTGFFTDAADFDPGAATAEVRSAGGMDAFVSKLNTSGAYVWAKAMGGLDSDYGRAIAVDSAGASHVTGNFAGTADFNPGAGMANRTSAGENDIFVAKLDAAGDFAWAKAMGGDAEDHGYGVSVYESAKGLDDADVFSVGYFNGTADFDPDDGEAELTSVGSSDGFISKLVPAEDPPVVAPTAESIAPDSTGPTNAASMDFAVVFSEAVVNFDSASDLVITHSGSTVNTGVTISGGATAYTATVTGISGNGSFTLAVNTGSDVEDTEGNGLVSSVTSASVVVDTTPPVIQLIGDALVTVIKGDTYDDDGATASDNLDGPLTGSIDTENLVNTDEVGEYTVTYTVSDAAGNGATPVVRTVEVEFDLDVDGSGSVNIIDMQYVINAIIGGEVPEEYDPDVNDDGVVNIRDVFEVIFAILEG
jgi:hypothetical protein